MKFGLKAQRMLPVTIVQKSSNNVYGVASWALQLIFIAWRIREGFANDPRAD